MKKILAIAFLLSFSSAAYAWVSHPDDGCEYTWRHVFNWGDGYSWEWVLVSCPTPIARADGLSGRNDSATFGLDDLVRTSIEGMLDSACGGYCITGFCINTRLTFSVLRGIRLNTIISPKIRTTTPDLLIASYNHTGDHPFDVWQNTVEEVIKAGNTSIIADLLGAEDGLQGGRGNPVEQDRHQSLSFKEVSIIGHPANILPEVITADGDVDALPQSNYQIPRLGSLPSQSVANQIDSNNSNAVRDPDQPRSSDFDLSEMFDNALVRVKDDIQDRLEAAISTLEGVELLESIQREIEVIQNVAEFVEVGLTSIETAFRSSVYANAARPRFAMERVFCPTNMQPLQPHYLSLADAFFWRSGYPITDGPISGSDHSSTILNPFSGDTLKPDPDRAEVWGHMYPREGTVNNNHDAKVATVAAWRAMDVLLNNVKDGADGTRVGVPLPVGYPLNGRWQMIYPEVKSCQASPAYNVTSLTRDFIEINTHGSYAWNYYNTQQCCSHPMKGNFLSTSINFPSPICL